MAEAIRTGEPYQTILDPQAGVPAEGMAAMSHYRVAARRWEHGWELHIEGVGVTQSRTLTGAARMARDYLALEFGGEPDSYTVEVVPDLDDDLTAAAEAARQAVRHAEQPQRVSQLINS